MKKTIERELCLFKIFASELVALNCLYPLRRDFLDVDLTTFFGVTNFRNTSAMRVIFFLKMFKI